VAAAQNGTWVPQVIPPITGGLHCGTFADDVFVLAVLVIPPITGGLHCGSVAGQGGTDPFGSHHAHYGRAPLRPVPQLLSPSRPGRVIPPITGGLHCG